ncbi:MAG: N-acetylmuramoyl-L-alanine amidase [bacterium]|nr:N-acetylmuramoyl-L-alanine amidase [bacterium]
MRGGRRRRKENGKAVCAAWTFLLTGCMAVMLYFASGKAVVIADASRDQTGLPVSPALPEGGTLTVQLRLEEASDAAGSLYIPLPRGIRAENIVMENRYTAKEIWLYMQGVEGTFYEENPVTGDLSHALGGSGEKQEDGVLLKIRMDRVLEYKSTLEGESLHIVWYEPHELYDYVCVLDPAWGGGEEGIGDRELSGKDVTLQTALQVQKGFSLENVRLYLTRTEDTETSPDQRASFAKEVKADLYLRLGVSRADTEEDYGIRGIYNTEYFIPGFGNAQLADLVTRKVTVAASNRALGLETAGEESILKGLSIPAAEISLGYLSNPQEEYLLGQETYREKLAEGILEALQEAVGMLEQEKLQ